jgi:hypothetical protein
MQNKQLIDGLLKRISEGGKFTTYLFRLSDGTYGRVFSGPKYRNFHNWKDFKIGDMVSGLVWYDEVKGILDGDSPVHITPVTIGN